MKYFVRFIKYLLYIIILFSVFISILVLLGIAEGNIETMFKNGYTSLWQMGIVFLVYAIIYPLIGYTKKEVLVSPELSNLQDKITENMENNRYKKVMDKDGTMEFRLKSPITKLSRMYEDKIKISITSGSIIIDGLRKDVIRISSRLEYLLTNS